MQQRVVAGSVLAAALGLAAAGPAAGQSLSELMSDLFVFGDCAVAFCLDHQFDETGDVLTEHGRHYLLDGVERNASLLRFVQDGVAGVAASLPASAMTGGRIWSDGGERSSLGPIFAERAETLGAGRFFLGLEASGLRVTNFSGSPSDALVLNFFHEDSDVAIGPDPPLGVPLWERDVFQVRTVIDMDLVVATAVLSAGLTSFLDIGVAVPVVRTRFKGEAQAQILPFDPSYQHRFGGTDLDPVLQASNSVSGSATGVGDISARLKINLTGGTPRDGAPSTVGVALLGDVTFPTGDEEDLLGTGEGRGRALAIFSGRWGGFSPHLNAGYLLREGNLSNDAVLGTIGFDAQATSGITVAADFITQWELDGPANPLPGPVTFAGPGAFTVEPSSVPDRDRYLMDLAIGLKFEVGSDMVLVTNALVPVHGIGLRPDVLWTLGLQGTFR